MTHQPRFTHEEIIRDYDPVNGQIYTVDGRVRRASRTSFTSPVPSMLAVVPAIESNSLDSSPANESARTILRLASEAEQL